MKLIYLISLLFVSIAATAQYQPSTDGTPVNRPIGATNFSTDARSYYHDAGNFCWRPFQSINEALAFLNTSNKRKGHFTIMVHVGGTLTGCDYIGGVNTAYWFKDGLADSNLVVMATGGGGSGTVTNVSSGNLLNLATVSVSNQASTPVFSYSMIQPTAHQFFGNNTGSTTAPSYVSIDTSDIATFAAKVRSLFAAGTGMSYNASSGTFTATGGGGATYRFGQSTDSLKLLLLGSGVPVDSVYFGGTSGGSGSGGSGSVSSVGLTMPSGFTVANSPVTSIGTLAVTTTLNGILRGNGSGFTAGTIDTTDIATFSNKVRSLFSISGGTYNQATGQFTVTGGGGSGTVTSFSANDLAPLFTTTEATVTTTPALSFTLTNAAAKTVFSNPSGSTGPPSYNLLDTSYISGFSAKVRPLFSGTAPVTFNSLTGVFAVPVSTNSVDGYLSAADHTTFLAKQNTITLTTTGTSGAATFSGGVLNIPSYSSGGGSGTVTSVSATVPTGFSASISNATTTPAINITTSLNGLVLGNGSGLSVATGTTEGNFLQYHSGVWQGVNSVAAITIDSTLQNSTGVLGINVPKLNALNKETDIAVSAYTVLSTDILIVSNYTGGTSTVTLPDPAANINREINIKNLSTNNVSVAGMRSGETNLLTQYGALRVHASSVYGWIAVGNN